MGWKKVLVSGSQAELNQLTVDNTVTANSFTGAGANITGVVHNAGEIASEISGSFTALSGSIASRFDGLSTSYTDLTNIPAGIISSSAQIDANLFNIDGLHSGSAQVVASLVNQTVNFGTGEVSASKFKGDGSGLTNIDVAQNATVTSTFTNQTSVAVNHNFGTKNVLVQVYNAADEMIIPATVVSTTANQSTVTFDENTSGVIVVAKGGHIVSGSVSSLDGQNGAYYLDFDNFTNVPAGIVSASVLSNVNQGTLRLATNGVNTDVDLGLQAGDSPTFTNLTLTGDLTVQGATTSIETTNLLVEDKFILINSGSGAADGGLVVNGAGVALGWDQSAGRWSTDSAGALANQTSISTDAFIAGVVDIDAGHSDIAAYQKNGNIKTDSGDIYIYS